MQSFSLWNKAPPGLGEIVSEKTLRLDFWVALSDGIDMKSFNVVGKAF